MNPQAQQPESYLSHGFTPFLERDPRAYGTNPILEQLNSPFQQQSLTQGYSYDPFIDQNMAPSNTTISGNDVQGGVLTSNDGQLVIDLNASTINYSDNATTLLNVGGTNAAGTTNSLTINNAAGTPIVSS